MICSCAVIITYKDFKLNRATFQQQHLSSCMLLSLDLIQMHINDILRYCTLYSFTVWYYASRVPVHAGTLSLSIHLSLASLCLLKW